MIDGEQIASGEMHYARIPRAYWRTRLEMAYAMGLNAISTYVFWNRHERQPGCFDFAAENDLAEYVREAAQAGLQVIIRPGPYVCAEWDFGGLPAWLLDGRTIALRSTDPAFMLPVRAWLQRLGSELSPLLATHGGPIVAIQLENEYGAFGEDRTYLEALRAALDDAGFAGSRYFTIDQPSDLARGNLSGVPMAATFAPGQEERISTALREVRADAPLLCGEFWAGWFDHWGEPHQQRDDAPQVDGLAWMLRNGAFVNLYMFHGGTNFGFYNGANASDQAPYQPTTTSYDYLAALDEAGRPTAKYYAFRNVIARQTGRALRPVPSSPATIDVPAFELRESACTEDLLGKPAIRKHPRSMESLGQSFGYTLYRTTVPKAGAGVLDIGEPRDYATILLDGVAIGRLDRRLAESALPIEVDRDGATLDILVENCGRVNYGPLLSGERKGIAGAVTLDGIALTGWRIFCLPLDRIGELRFQAGIVPAPAFYRGRFELEAVADTFFDMQSFGKGTLFVNGRNAGRFWNIGPQRSLYVPGGWLGRTNEVVVFDVIGASGMFIRGTREPII